MKLKLLHRIITLSKLSIYGILMQCLLFNSIWAKDIPAQKIVSMNDIGIEPNNNVLKKSNSNKNNSVHTVEDIDISGKISDENGEGLPGATVVVKGTTNGTATDIDGNYKLSVSEDAVLVISFVGYQVKEINVAGRTVIDIQLNPNAEQLENIVVTGYQTVDRRLFAGSAARVKMEDIKLDGVADISRSLQGEVAGVEVENVSGTFGTAPVVRIRGNASINGANKPLWVIDGVVLEDAVELSNEDITTGDLSTILSSSTVGLNPEDIESFQVLKDASATALYGARAMNGVIVVTTKKGRSGVPTVQYTSTLTVKSKPTYAQFNFLSSGAEMGVYKELYDKGWVDIASANGAKNHGAFSNMFYQIANNKINWGAGGTPNYPYLQRYANANTDWFDLLFKNSLAIQNSISVSSGTEKAMFRVSIGYLDDKGQTVADNVKNYTGAMNATFNLSDKINLGFKLSGNVRDQKLAASENRKFNALSGKFERNFDINPFNYALYTSRSITPFDENGDRQFFRRNYAPFNILHEIEHNTLELNLSDMLFQVNFGYDITEGLTFKTTAQGRWYNSKAIQSVHENSNNAMSYRADNPLIRNSNIFLFDDPDNNNLEPYSVLPQGGFRKTTENALTSYYFRNTLNFSPKIDEDHAVNILVGQEIRYIDRSKDYFEGWGYVFDKGGLILTDPNFIRYLDARGVDYFKVTNTRSRSWGTFANLAYSYKSKYIFNGTFRYDGDNRTGKSKKSRYLPTWNVSGAWNIHEEPWMNISAINLIKLKSTYGLSGDNPFNASAGLILKGKEPLRPHLTERETALIIEGLENSDLTFEKLYEFNLGLELELFNGTVFAEMAYYRRSSKDLIGYIETNGVGGVKSKYGNIGEMKIDGLEVTLKTTNIRTSNFNWTTRFTYNYTKNEITKWQSRDRIGDAISRNGANIIGYPRGALFSVPFAGLDNNGVPTFLDEKGEKIQELNLQEREDITKHLKYEGSTTPTGFGGISNTLKYKDISFSFSMVYRYGNKIRLDDVFRSTYSDHTSLPGDLINRWAFEGDEKLTNIPAILNRALERKLDASGLNPYELYNKSDLRIADGDFLRLKSVRLAYNIPKNLLDNTFFKSAALSFSAYNLWLLYADKKLNGIDPEFFQSGGVSLPQTRSYSFTLNLKF